MPDDITLDGQSDGGSLTDAGGAASVGGSESMSLPELNEFLGKSYPTKEAALKSIKDTFSYTGQVGQMRKQLEALTASKPGNSSEPSELESTVRSLKEQLEETTFLSERPEFKEYLPTLRELRTGTGKSMSELAGSEAYKALFEKAFAQDATQKKRSVLESNPRLGSVRDKTQESRDSLAKGDLPAARESAVSAVLDAFEMK